MALQPYTKQQWVDHQVDEATSEIIVLGTPADKIHFDHLEDGIQTADARAIEALGGVEALQLPVADNTKARHTHGNKGVLDGITAALITGWNGAVDHITDAVKHITAAERTLWNTITSKADKAEVSEQLSAKADIEDGIWTPQLFNSGTAQYTATGSYTLSGHTVTINCTITITSKGTMGSTFEFTGLPLVAYTDTPGSFGIFTTQNADAYTFSRPYVFGDTLAFVDVRYGSIVSAQQISDNTKLVVSATYRKAV